MTPLPFFLHNRELACLVLDHLDHKTIGVFRQLCKRADLCARQAFLRTSVDGVLSYRSLEHTRVLSTEFVKAKISHWTRITIEDVRGLVNFSRVLRELEGVKVDNVVTVSIKTLVFRQYLGEDKRVYVLAPLVGRAFNTLGYYLRPRNLCLGPRPYTMTTPDDTGVTSELRRLMLSWPLENVTCHEVAPVYAGLGWNVPRQHVFFDQYLLAEYPVVKQYPADLVLRPQTLTFRHRWETVQLVDPDGVHIDYIYPDMYGAEDVEVVGPGGVRYVFPGRYKNERCAFCNYYQ